MRIAIIIVVCIASGAVYAEPKMVARPCEREQAQSQVGGVDTDEMQCQLAISVQALTEAQIQIIGLQAHIRLVSADLLAANHRAATLQKRLGEYPEVDGPPSPAVTK